MKRGAIIVSILAVIAVGVFLVAGNTGLFQSSQGTGKVASPTIIPQVQPPKSSTALPATESSAQVVTQEKPDISEGMRAEKSKPSGAESNEVKKFLDAYKSAHANKDIEALSKLVYWNGVPKEYHNMWKANLLRTFQYPIKVIEMKGTIDDSFKTWNFSLPCTHTLSILYESSLVPGTEMTEEYPVGKKGEDFFLVLSVDRK